jgi:hypothetical protein
MVWLQEELHFSRLLQMLMLLLMLLLLLMLVHWLR